ncbi:MAG: ribulokinase [Anaerolineaceae bacterium]|nr:ribulokinase [Anaerolineaceae bacterium]
MKKFVIGLDFGTESARAVLVNTSNGEIISTAVHQYEDGVIDEVLPIGEVMLPPHWALQNPDNWLAAVRITISKIMKESGLQAELIVGLGVDFTACTVLPAMLDGTPLNNLEKHRYNPHAWAKLWKHHGAQSQADRVNKVAEDINESWLPRYGGKVSSEWLLPKALEVLEQAPEIYQETKYFVEGADWLIWQLTGKLVRNACCAGYKGTWHKQDGFPKADFLKALHPGLGDLFSEKVSGVVLAPGECVAGLSEEWAKKLGLSAGLPVAAAIIDAHSAAIGGGVCEAGTMFMIMGTSTCHMLMAQEEVLIEGISGVVEDGIIPGLYGYEAGQAGVGDIFAWFVEHNIPAVYQKEAETQSISIHDLLSEKASDLKPGQSGLLALDWWNGCRTPLVDAELSGVILGYTLNTKPEEIYRALIEATAFGTRLIIELFKEGGVPVNKLIAGGGLTKNNLLLQIYADSIGLPIEIAASPLSSALGAAILASVSGDVYTSIHEAVQNMVAPPAKIIVPNQENHLIYSQLYKIYRELVDQLGRDEESPLKKLNTIKRVY